jgi:hypothetical protein
MSACACSARRQSSFFAGTGTVHRLRLTRKPRMIVVTHDHLRVSKFPRIGGKLLGCCWGYAQWIATTASIWSGFRTLWLFPTSEGVPYRHQSAQAAAVHNLPNMQAVTTYPEHHLNHCCDPLSYPQLLGSHPPWSPAAATLPPV